jgi:hypothetical protein
MKILYSNSYQSFYLALNWFQKGDFVELWSAKEHILTTARRIGIPTRELPYFKAIWWILRPNRMKTFFNDIALSLNKNCEFHFTHTQWDTFLFRLIPFIRSKKCTIKICLWDVEYTYPELKPGFNYIVARLEHLVSESFFPSKMILKEFKGIPVFGINSSYCKRWRVEIPKIQFDYLDMVAETCKKVRLDLERINWLFIEQPDFLLDKEKELFFIERILDLKCMVKPHPASQRKGWGKYLYGQDYPLELIVMQVDKGVVGLYSAGLVYAAKQGLKSISLLLIVFEFLSQNGRKYAEILKEELQLQSHGKILFPNDWDELLKLME